jgi:hypothetical protein
MQSSNIQKPRLGGENNIGQSEQSGAQIIRTDPQKMLKIQLEQMKESKITFGRNPMQEESKNQTSNVNNQSFAIRQFSSK